MSTLKKRFFDKRARKERQEKQQHISQESLLVLARHSIQTAINGTGLDEALLLDIKKVWGSINKGVRISIYVGNKFCGSYGELKSNKNVYDDVINFSTKASFEDNRFPPLTTENFKNLDIEIFLIEEAEVPIEYNDPLEFTMLLGKHKDMGLVIRKDKKESYYLPDTWDMIPDPSMFISSLCVNAGLPASAWRGEKRLWPQKVTERKRDLYTGKVIEPEEYAGIDILGLDVIRIRGKGN